MSGMAEVLAAHSVHGMSGGTHLACRCNRAWVLMADYRAHLESELSAAGFGPVKEAAAAGVRSIGDIWGAGGRRTVRMEELHEVDASILSGEWDNHIKWNLADIAKERARAAAVRGEG